MFDRAAWHNLERNRHAATGIGLARGDDLVQKVNEALLHDIGQRLARLHPYYDAATDELPVGGVCHLKYVLRPPQHDDEARCLLKHPGQPLTLRGNAAVGLHAARGLHHGNEHACYAATIVAQRTKIKVEPGILAVAMSLDTYRLVGERARLAPQHRLVDRRVERPQLWPAVARRLPKRPGVPWPADDGVSVVVDLHEVGAPKYEHGQRRAKHEADHRAKRRRPAVDGAKRRQRPVQCANKRARRAATGWELNVGDVRAVSHETVRSCPHRCDWRAKQYVLRDVES